MKMITVNITQNVLVKIQTQCLTEYVSQDALKQVVSTTTKTQQKNSYLLQMHQKSL